MIALALALLAAAPSQDYLDELERRAEQSLSSIHRARTPEEAAAARPELRRRLEHALGYKKMPWPPKPKGRVTGTVRRAGYRIDKVVFESLPGVAVPGHLYLPEGATARLPAILFYNGHWYEESKTLPDHQAFAIHMARSGFAVFSFDPFGQGERGVSTRDHRRVSSLLTGISQQGFAEYETQCALEYLLSRPEVDPQRIGMTGASGGGYNTWITASLDDRIRVAVPVAGTSQFALQINFARQGDWYHAAEHCHFVPGLITFADNHELLAMIAPRPVLVINSATDPGFVAGTLTDYGRDLYAAHGMAARFGYFNDPTSGHGYQQRKREAAYGWFLRHLMGRGDGSPSPEGPVDIAPPDAAELRCFPDGKRAAGPGMEAYVRTLAAGIRARGPAVPSRFFASEPAVAATPALNGQSEQRFAVAVNGVSIPALLLRPQGAPKGLLVAALDTGKETLAAGAVTRQARKRGWSVLGIDVRGIGELRTDKAAWTAAVSLLAGDHFVWRQAGDMLAVVRAVHATPEYARLPLAWYARGDNAALASTYAIAEAARKGPSISAYALREGFVSFRQFLDRPVANEASYRLLEKDERERRFTAWDREIPFWYVPFDVLRVFDLPDLLAASPASGTVLHAIDGDWKRISPAAARLLLPRTVSVVEAEQELVERLLSNP
ncbi:MAG: acetylxylan esterase [Bryobacterales bacterium]|nr:acetylxylan esterase [Bryobacterales bacterium]